MNWIKISPDRLLRSSGPFKLIEESGATGIPELHLNEADVFLVLEGVLEFVLGGTLENSHLAPTDPTSYIGDTIRGGTTLTLGAGECLYIPPNCPHQRLSPQSTRSVLLKISS